MAYACRVMRGLIIDYARRRRAQKRGGEFEITVIATDIAGAVANVDELTDLNGRPRRTRNATGAYRARRRSQVFLWLLLRGNRVDVGRIGADRAARLGEGADFPARPAAR